MTEVMNRLLVHAIDADRLARIRAQGVDEHGNAFQPYPAGGGEPLRCCLQPAAPGDPIALISYAPFQHVSPWTEVGPVYVHGDGCAGHDGGLPEQFRTGPRVLRTYDAENTLDYAHITVVPDGADLQPYLDELFAVPEVATVHVRAVETQCFTYAVTAA
jgi:hypothetical protein